MTSPREPAQIAYLAPELPSLSETFVYEEMFALQDLGFSILSISVHKPLHPAREQEELNARTIYLYDQSCFRVAVSGVFRLPLLGFGAFKAFGLLAADLLRCGVQRFQTWKLAFQFLVAAKLARLLKANKCSHLHVHFADVPAQIAMYASAMSGVPFSIMAHANDIFARGRLLRQKADRAVKMLTISEFNRAFLESIGVPRNKLAIVRCGVSFRFSPPDRQFQRQERYRLGTLGRMVDKKGFDVLIRAIAELQNRPFHIELSIAGDGPLRGDLEALADTLGIAQSVRFEGAIAHGDVAAWMRSLDAFVLACKEDGNGGMDGIPVALMEAMSQSVPVISTRISGIPELIIHDRTGLLANPCDYQDLSIQIEKLMEMPELRERFVREAAEHLEKEFGRNVNLRRLINYFSGEAPTL